MVALPQQMKLLLLCKLMLLSLLLLLRSELVQTAAAPLLLLLWSELVQNAAAATAPAAVDDLVACSQ